MYFSMDCRVLGFKHLSLYISFNIYTTRACLFLYLKSVSISSLPHHSPFLLFLTCQNGLGEICAMFLFWNGKLNLNPVSVRSLIAKWLKQASHWHEMYCHDLEFMSSNPGRAELGLHSSSVLCRTWSKNITTLSWSMLRHTLFIATHCKICIKGNHPEPAPIPKNILKQHFYYEYWHLYCYQRIRSFSKCTEDLQRGRPRDIGYLSRQMTCFLEIMGRVEVV